MNKEKKVFAYSANRPGLSLTFSTEGLGNVLKGEKQELKNGMIQFGENNKFTTKNAALANVIEKLPRFEQGVVFRVKSKAELAEEAAREAQKKAAIQLRTTLTSFSLDLNTLTVHQLREQAEPIFFAEEIEGMTKGQLVGMLEEKTGYRSPKASGKKSTESK